MKPHALAEYLDALVRNEITLSTMIWGPPGIGKSSIVAQTAARYGFGFIDVRLSQLAPTDLRGLPVPEGGVSRWYPPEFLPRDGRGILFLDELNMAPPAMQGMAQQLILDRRVGSYEVPAGWFIWAAGNRKEDRAAVFDMPAPLANRFVHLEVEPDFDNFKAYALERGLHEQIIAFLSFRSALLHRMDPQQPAWPSPRSWEMASRLHGAGLDIAPVVGPGAAAEFRAFVSLYATMVDMEAILRGDGAGLAFPSEPSQRYALTVGLGVRARDARQAHSAFRWLADAAGGEWSQLFAMDLFRQMRARGQMGELAALVKEDERLQAFLRDYRGLLGVA
ncbi:MAG: MoxR family ATPase [Chloroflexales bacterium]|nr:MoxR family ATPase [Chloroflexales bacterium]